MRHPRHVVYCLSGVLTGLPQTSVAAEGTVGVAAEGTGLTLGVMKMYQITVMVTWP